MSKFRLFKQEDPSDPLIGRRFGQFRVVERLAEGTLGSVYKGVDSDSEDKEVAFKFLNLGRLEIDSRTYHETLERYARDITKSTRVRHEHVVHTFGVRAESDCVYVLMEYLRGLDLYERSQQQPALSYLEICQMASQVCEALNHMWKYNRQPHGDLKPRNIMYHSPSSVKLLDVGVAKAIFGRANLSFDANGVALGPLHYIAPEQHLGTLPMDPRSDLFALGVILCELFTFRTPFRGNSLQELYESKRKGIPFEIEKYAPNLPDTVIELIYQMVEATPARRANDYEKVEAVLAAAIRELEEQEALKAQLNPNPERTLEIHVNDLHRARRGPLRSKDADGGRMDMKPVEELLRDRPKTVVPGLNDDPMASIRPGIQIGDYMLGGLLGKGPHGMVYFATQQSTRSAVTVKILQRPPRRDPMTWVNEALERAQRICLLEHRAIANLRSIEFVEPYLFIVSDPYLGPNDRPLNLIDYCKHYGDSRNRLTERMAQWFGLVVLEALDYSHKVGVVHGNLKSENILFHCVGEEGEEFRIHMMLTDSSIRRVMDLEPSKGPGMEMAGVVESNCLSPEQRKGDEASMESDLFSVGGILLRCLIGQETLPPGKTASELRDGLNPCWDPVLDRVLSADPYRRYRSAEEMALVIEGLPLLDDEDDAEGASAPLESSTSDQA